MSTLFDTDCINPSERPDFWQDVVCNTFVRLDCSLTTPGNFQGRLEACEFGDISLVDIRASGQRVTRHRDSISHSDDEFFLVSLASRGRAQVAQEGREAALNEGDFTIYDTRQPYVLHFDGAFQQTVVQIPRKILSCRLSNIEYLTAMAMSRNNPLEKLVFEYFSGLMSLDSRLTPTQKSRLADQGLDLLAMALSERGKGQVPNSSRRTALLFRIKDYIQQNLGDNEFCLAQVSQFFGISARYINSLFQEEDTSFGRYLLAARLQHCAYSLRDAALSQARISDIAYRWGFSDMAYFSRVFKVRYGQSARDFRKCEPHL
ncbi:helix-turn-helix domain-containing protein [Pseudomonas fluorescens]|uniref:AraC-like ligand-binding domain-containing protein n=1 Tax=Pseudomonas fluorescens TaxID=294 RepID=UPI003F97F5A0